VQRRWAEYIIQVVNAIYPDASFENWEHYRRYLPHALECAILIEDYQIVSMEAAQLLNRVSWYLREQGFYMQAEPLLQQALAIVERSDAFDQSMLVSILSNLALLHRHQGRYEEAEPLSVRALAIRERSLGPDHPNTATTLNNLALLYQYQGRYEEAEPLFLRALVIYERSLGPDHPQTAVLFYNLAYLYHQQANYQQAEHYYQRAIAIGEQVYGPNHPKIADDLEAYVRLLWIMKRDKEAAQLLNHALRIREVHNSSSPSEM
jgi:tetratricopeptide (TPR) repeat protein